MTYSRIILITVLTCAPINTPYARTPQATDSPQLVESRNLTARVVQLYRERKYDEALPLAKRSIELAERAFGSQDSRLISLLIRSEERRVGKECRCRWWCYECEYS